MHRRHRRNLQINRKIVARYDNDILIYCGPLGFAAAPEVTLLVTLHGYQQQQQQQIAMRGLRPRMLYEGGTRRKHRMEGQSLMLLEVVYIGSFLP